MRDQVAVAFRMQARAVLVNSLVASLIALGLGFPTARKEDTTPEGVVLETTMVELHKRSLSDFENDTSIESTASDSSVQNRTRGSTPQILNLTDIQEPKRMITRVRWVPGDLGLATPKPTTEVYMGAVIAMPPLSCPNGYRRQSGRCRKVFY